MGGKVAGPICTTRVGRGWIDDGTLCRSRSSASGPLGLAMSLVFGAAPGEGTRAEKSRDDKAMFADDLREIADSPFGRTKEGKAIVGVLRSMLASGNVVYGGNLDGNRGDWDGKTIRVDKEVRGNKFRTTSELVHEASHVLWRRAHGKQKDPVKRLEDDIADELHARENQLLVYTYLRDAKGCPKDLILEMRLERQAAGTLESTIRQAFEDPI